MLCNVRADVFGVIILAMYITYCLKYPGENTKINKYLLEIAWPTQILHCHSPLVVTLQGNLFRP